MKATQAVNIPELLHSSQPKQLAQELLEDGRGTDGLGSTSRDAPRAFPRNPDKRSANHKPSWQWPWALGSGTSSTIVFGVEASGRRRAIWNRLESLQPVQRASSQLPCSAVPCARLHQLQSSNGNRPSGRQTNHHVMVQAEIVCLCGRVPYPTFRSQLPRRAKVSRDKAWTRFCEGFRALATS